MDCSPQGYHKATLSTRFSRQEYWSDLPFAISFSGGSFQPRDQTRISCVFCIAGRLFTTYAIREAKNQLDWAGGGCKALVEGMQLEWILLCLLTHYLTRRRCQAQLTSPGEGPQARPSSLPRQAWTEAAFFLLLQEKIPRHCQPPARANESSSHWRVPNGSPPRQPNS